MGLPWLSIDGKKLLVTRILRTFVYGYLAVVLGIYLDQLGLSAIEIGIVFSGAILGSSAMTVLWSLVADGIGRRRTVAVMAALMAVGGLIFAVTSNFWILLLGAFTGTISATSSEVGIFQTVEQAILPQTAPDERRTWLFSIYNTVATFAGAFGSLAAASVGLFSALGFVGADAYRPLFYFYAAVGVVNLLIFMTLSDKVETAKIQGARKFIGIHRSTGTVVKLSLLFGLDSFAGGFTVESIIAYWFFLRWGLPTEQLAVIFFWMNVFSALSLLAAGWLASRFGLLNTMVFTHLPSHFFLIFIPLAPIAPLAIASLLVNRAMSQMDVPTRQSYTMAVVDPDERTATAGITNVARSAAKAAAPTFAGMAINAAALGLPFFISGGLKILYDILIYFNFRNVHPPEEAEIKRKKQVAAPARPSGAS
jgi:MFS family permease